MHIELAGAHQLDAHAACFRLESLMIKATALESLMIKATASAYCCGVLCVMLGRHPAHLAAASASVRQAMYRAAARHPLSSSALFYIHVFLFLCIRSSIVSPCTAISIDVAHDNTSSVYLLGGTTHH